MQVTAVVTGGASGIGRAVAEALVARGDLVVLADVDEAVDRVAKEITQGGPGTAVPAIVDVRDAQAVRVLVENAHRENGRLDLMFNSAGVGIRGGVEELSSEHWNLALDVNVRGVIHGVHAAYPLMLAQGFGHIVNTASMAGLLPAPLLAPYSMSKHAVVGLSLSLRGEAADRGVKVSVVCPGAIQTPALDKDNPPGLPSLQHMFSAREYLERSSNAYSASAVAADILHGVRRNRAIIIAPRTAHVQWLIQRAVPRLIEHEGRKHVAWIRASMGIAPLARGGRATSTRP